MSTNSNSESHAAIDRLRRDSGVLVLFVAIAALLAPSARAQVTWAGNGHAYQYVPFAGTWLDARTAAESLSYNGQPGYLATISTSGENTFLIDSLPEIPDATAWIGASDAGANPLVSDPLAEGHWQWVTGPESAIQFWSGPALPVGGSTPPFFYANWRPFFEPNDFGGEDFAEWTLGDWGGIPKGEWIDSNILGTNANVVGFIVEFGSPFQDLGFGLAGVSGVPLLVGTGPLVGGTPGKLTLSNARPSSSCMEFISLSSAPASFKGGMLVPLPPLLLLPFTTSPSGTLLLAFTWPEGVPSAFSLYFQYAIADAAAVNGVSLSNAVRGKTP